jgi:type III pantothenate kinase
MNVLVDIGNSRTKYQLAEHKGSSDRITVNNTTIDEQWLDLHWSNAESITIASVKGGELSKRIKQWAVKKQIPIQFIATEKERFGITNCYHIPERLGVDRWLSLIGGSFVYPNKGLVIVDAGTATTLDVLDKDGNHQGGWILSGIDIMLDQIGKNTSKVKYSINDEPSTLFGQSTSDCVNNAAWAATVGMINLGISKASNEYSIDCCILLGGNAQKLSSLITFPNVIVNEELIFEGLKRY